MWKVVATFCFGTLASAQTAPGGPGITVDPGAPLLNPASVFRGFGATSTASGDIVLEVTIDAKGEVTDAYVVSGPMALRRTAIESVLEWHYATHPSPPPRVRVAIHFTEPPQRPNDDRSSIWGPSTPLKIRSIEIAGVTPEIAQQVRAHVPAQVGDQAGAEMLARVAAAAHQIDEHFIVWLREEFFAPGEGNLWITINNSVSSEPPSYTSSTASPSPAAERIWLDPKVAARQEGSRIRPPYPPLARQLRVEGDVEFEVIIGTDGSVKHIDVISGHPVLVGASLEAVKQFVYKPTIRDGKPVEVATRVIMTFTLSQ